MVEKAITEEEYLRPLSGMAIKIVGFSLLKCPVCKFWSTWRGRGTPLITLDLGG
jgi:hypothetical protein